MPQTTIRPIQVRPRVHNRWAHANYLGVRDSLDPTREDTRLAFLLRNVYPLQPEVGGGVVGRPGHEIMDDQITGPIQRIYQFTKLDGTEHTHVIAAGEIYDYDWATNTLTKELTAAEITGAGATLETTGLVYCVTFADLMVVSDGVNPPFTWDGTVHSGVVPMTNCPVLFGPPTIYYSKLFGIKAAERSTIVWSEENQPNVGYEAGGYNNAWTLGQTDQEQLFALLGTNDALYYWRARSIGAIWGPANASFRTTGTHDAVSLKVGTRSPGSVVQYRDAAYFLDAEARPQRLILGGEVVDDPGIWELCAETVLLIDEDYLADFEARYAPNLDLIQFGVRRITAENSLDMILNFDSASGRFVGFFDGFEFTTFGVAAADPEIDTPVHGDLDGYCFFQGRADGDIWTDNLPAGLTEIRHEIITSVFGFDMIDTTLFDRADILLRVDAAISSISIGCITPSGESDAATLGVFATMDFWDVGLWDVALWSTADTLEYRSVIGLNQHGRWLRIRFAHDGLDEQFGLLGVAVSGTRQGAQVRLQ